MTFSRRCLAACLCLSVSVSRSLSLCLCCSMLLLVSCIKTMGIMCNRGPHRKGKAKQCSRLVVDCSDQGYHPGVDLSDCKKPGGAACGTACGAACGACGSACGSACGTACGGCAASCGAACGGACGTACGSACGGACGTPPACGKAGSGRRLRGQSSPFLPLGCTSISEVVLCKVRDKHMHEEEAAQYISLSFTTVAAAAAVAAPSTFFFFFFSISQTNH